MQKHGQGFTKLLKIITCQLSCPHCLVALQWSHLNKCKSRRWKWRNERFDRWQGIYKGCQMTNMFLLIFIVMVDKWGRINMFTHTANRNTTVTNCKRTHQIYSHKVQGNILSCKYTHTPVLPSILWQHSPWGFAHTGGTCLGLPSETYDQIIKITLALSLNMFQGVTCRKIQ